MTITRLLALALVCAGLAGCTNSIYYYQTDKFGLGVEGRPDSTQPVSGTFGFKQRVVTIVPSKDDVVPEVDTPTQEAMSLISYFDFKLKDKPGTMLDPLTVNTALITGRAASELNKTEAQTAFSAPRAEQDRGADRVLRAGVRRHRVPPPRVEHRLGHLRQRPRAG